MINDIDEIIDQLYLRIHKFLVNKVGDDLIQDLIDINIESEDNGEITINLELNLEISPFSDHNVQVVAKEAIKDGIKLADQICPSYVVKSKTKR